MSDITAQLRAVVNGADPARWIVDAATILGRITPQLFEDCHTTIRSATPAPLEQSTPNLAAMAVFAGTTAVEPSLRRGTLTTPATPMSPVEGRRIWAGYTATLDACQPMLRPAWRMPRPRTPKEAQFLLARLATHASEWEAQGQRANDFRPVMHDVAHRLRHLVTTDLAGWCAPRRVGATACHNAGIDPRCKVSPVKAKGLCAACYMRHYRARGQA